LITTRGGGKVSACGSDSETFFMNMMIRTLSLVLLVAAFGACVNQPAHRTASRKVQRLEAIDRPFGPKTYVFRDVDPSEPQGPRVLQ
jgi:hypothetical protein